MIRASVILAIIPLGIFSTVGLPRAPASPDVVTVAVTTEGVRRVALDTRTFSARWLPVNNMPPMQLAAAKQPGEVTPLPPDHPRTARREVRVPARRDVCGRHGMRKVSIRGGRSWRCRR